ncbi:hypothetical protein HSBAA_PA_3960 (plasmid) [Vreelandella sulfidaeris]|uniref:Uncharacterized protein n=1 Tax=Vreelandella sulfidaeris TaxID=115553 RepID=A0A455UKC3_9GAMM|nr:hypothetical protein HSBAA_PA_3960 [Halomonas sulfidaeris]
MPRKIPWACQTAKRQIGEIDGQQLEYQGCPKGNPDNYWKAEGSVTALYALEQFNKGGAGNAEVYINALRARAPKALLSREALRQHSGSR